MKPLLSHLHLFSIVWNGKNWEIKKYVFTFSLGGMWGSNECLADSRKSAFLGRITPSCLH